MIFKINKSVRNLFNKNKYLTNIYQKANRVKTSFLSNVSDERFAKFKYKERTGRKLNLDNPQTYNEKLWWLKLNNRDPLLTICSDKVLVRDYVVEQGFPEILVPMIGAYDDVSKINFDEIPEDAFLKTNHGSGTNLIWKKNLDRRKVKKIFEDSLQQNYFYQSREWNYKNIKPQVVIEENLNKQNSGKEFFDYKFLCFDGRVEYVLVFLDSASDDGTHNHHAKSNLYDRDFNPLNATVARENFNKKQVKIPENFEKMLEIAEKLSEPFVFCRVDLYNFDGQIYFGEITFYPGGATQIINPESLELKLGELIDLNSPKIIRKKSK
ncbi:carboxylate--amine ligase [Aerococcaceae bacterium DSM 111020]|nr:carboxylate--amine ligase [Aerococcaceae bacterium DSM 111020]